MAEGKNLVGQTVEYRLDDSDDPGYALAKVLKKLETPAAKAVKAVYGYEVYRIEILEVVKPSFAGKRLKPGTKRDISAKHLTVQD